MHAQLVQVFPLSFSHTHSVLASLQVLPHRRRRRPPFLWCASAGCPAASLQQSQSSHGVSLACESARRKYSLAIYPPQHQHPFFFHRLWFVYVGVSLSSTKCTCCPSWALTHSLPALSATHMIGENSSGGTCRQQQHQQQMTAWKGGRALRNISYYPLRARRLKGKKNIATLPLTTTSKGRGEKTIWK